MPPATPPSQPPGDRVDELPDARALQARRREAATRLSELRARFGELVAASAGSNADDEHDPEGATIAFERAQLDALVRRAVDSLAEIDAALERSADGRYGLCIACGHRIPPARLQARPTARTCTGCRLP